MINQENAGEAAARNRGIREALHPFIAFLDADDAWKPGFLETVWLLSCLYPEAGAYATAFECMTPAKNLVPDPNAISRDKEHGLIDDFFGQAYQFPMHISAVMVPKAVLEEVGGFSTRELYGNEVDTDILVDADLLLIIALRHPIAYCNEIQSTYYQDTVNRISLRHAQMRFGEPVLSRTAREALRSFIKSSSPAVEARTVACRRLIVSAALSP